MGHKQAKVDFFKTKQDLSSFHFFHGLFTVLFYFLIYVLATCFINLFAQIFSKLCRISYYLQIQRTKTVEAQLRWLQMLVNAVLIEPTLCSFSLSMAMQQPSVPVVFAQKRLSLAALVLLSLPQ